MGGGIDPELSDGVSDVGEVAPPALAVGEGAGSLGTSTAELVVLGAMSGAPALLSA